MSPPRYPVCLLLACGVVAGMRADTVPPGSKAVGMTAVCSRVSSDYVRAKNPDGSLKPEEYAFGDGGLYPGTFKDGSIDRLKFLDVAGVLAAALRAQNYIPARTEDSERLLIMVHWGTTNVDGASLYGDGESYRLAHDAGGARPGGSPGSAAAGRIATIQNLGFEEQRNHIDFMNAKLLGYDSEDLVGTFYGASVGHLGVLGNHRDELLYELEDNRYFVVLIAYDFQRFRKNRQKKVVWESRFSINEPKNDFSRALPVMAKEASKYFGQDSHGLLRQPVKDGTVEVGEPKTINVVDPARR